MYCILSISQSKIEWLQENIANTVITSGKILENTTNITLAANTFTFNDVIHNLKWTNTVLKSPVREKCSDAFKT